MSQENDDAPSPPQGSGETILLVEDNLHNRRIFAGILRHYGYQVEEAEDGAEALEVANRIQPALILMDLSLPVMDGWEATQKIKENPELKAIPVVALTAHAMAGDEDRARQAGCDGYLSKPISPKLLVKKVQAFLAGPQSRKEP